MFVTGPRVANPHTQMTISHAEVIERAQTIGLVAKRNAIAAEQLRRLPDENVVAIMESGLMPLLRPKIFGGYEGDWITHIDAVSEVARFCGSTGWVMSFLLQHQFFLSLFPIEAQRMVYDRHPDPKIVTSFAPTGKVKRVAGGYELSGTWMFGSGGDHCDWAIVGGVLPNGDKKEFWNFLLSPGQFRIDRVWNSVGLKGSGSNNIVVDDPLFIPENLSYSQKEALVGRAPGAAFHEGRMFRAPLSINSGFGVMAPLHGLARGVFESFVEFTKGRVALIGDNKSSDGVETQNAIGEAKAEIDLAYLLSEKLSATAFAPGAPSLDDIFRTRRDFIMVNKILQKASNRLFHLSGARGLDEGLPMQRLWRDMNAIDHHFTFAVPALQTAGRQALGLGPAAGDEYLIPASD